MRNELLSTQQKETNKSKAYQGQMKQIHFLLVNGKY